eukprot:5985932-Prorocentrum_lima.AAC.1
MTDPLHICVCVGLATLRPLAPSGYLLQLQSLPLPPHAALQLLAAQEAEEELLQLLLQEAAMVLLGVHRFVR